MLQSFRVWINGFKKFVGNFLRIYIKTSGNWYRAVHLSMRTLNHELGKLDVPELARKYFNETHYLMESFLIRLVNS